MFFLTVQLLAQNFKGKPGFYYKGSAHISTPSNAYTIPFIDGIFILAHWSNIEPAKSEFDWSFIDSEILKAKNNNKDVAIGILHPPDWIHDSLGAPVYHYIKDNPYNPSHGDTLMGYITWDLKYLNRLDTLTKHLARKYANDTTIKYFNFVSSLITRGFPDSVITNNGLSPFWMEFNYDVDTILPHLKYHLDRYMALFPNTPLWSSIDYVKFEMQASGNPTNFLILQYVDYGVNTYPERFGLWREDLSGCIRTWGLQNSGSVWYTMAQQSCRHGSQMLWHLQDGPYRMNKCNIAPPDFSATSKITVLDSIFELGMSMGMRYYEIYPVDLNDADLENTFIKWHEQLDTICQLVTYIPENYICDENFTIYPNPTNGYLRIVSKAEFHTIEATIYNIFGEKITSFNNASEIDISELSSGNYYMRIIYDNMTEIKRIIKF